MAALGLSISAPFRRVRHAITSSGINPGTLLAGVGDFGIVGDHTSLFTTGNVVVADTDPVLKWAGQLGLIDLTQSSLGSAGFYDAASNSASLNGNSLKT